MVADDTRARLEAGLDLHRAGKLDEAQSAYRAILAEAEDNPDANHFLGLIAHQRGDQGEAVRRIRRAIELDQARPTFHYNLGTILGKSGQWEAAALALERATVLEPGSAEIQYSFGTALGQLKRYVPAETAFRYAIERQPGYAEALSGLAGALHGQGRNEEAEKSARDALAIAPDLPQAHTNLGNILATFGEIEVAERHHRLAIKAAPDYAIAYYNLARLLSELGRPSDAQQSFRQALEIEPSYRDAADNLLFSLTYDENETAASIFEAHREWGENLNIVEHTGLPTYPNSRDPDRRLRIGYVSADFKTHSCAYFLEPVFFGHNREVVTVYAYANVDEPDETTARLRDGADHWRDIHGVEDYNAAAMIAADEIDILIDLSGHTRGNRLDVFALRPAPVQSSWLGYPATTGLGAIDYRFTDAVTDPPGTGEGYHTEQLVRLPWGFCCYSPPSDAPAVVAPPSVKSGRITFGSFNNPLKLSGVTLDLWANILGQLPQSTILLKGMGLDRSVTARRLNHEFTDRGIDPDRVRLQGWISRDAKPLNLYGEIDIALDTTPYNGTTTSLEALFMGVPVISLAGDRHASRVGASLLHQLGRPEWITNTSDEYVTAAVNLAENIPHLAKIRATQRDRLIRSTLCNASLFVSEFEDALKNIWYRWCKS